MGHLIWKRNFELIQNEITQALECDLQREREKLVV